VKKLFIPPYIEQAVLDLEAQAKVLSNNSEHRITAASFYYVSRFLRSSIKVMLPDNGEIYRENNGGGRCPDEEEIKSMEGCPAPVVSLCYKYTYSLSVDEKNSATTVSAPKRITLIVDEKQIFPEAVNDNPNIQLFSVFYSDQYRLWSLSPLSIAIPKQKIFFTACREDFKKETGRESRIDTPWKFNVSVFDLTACKQITTRDVKNKDFFFECFSQYLPDITAMTQCFHSLRANALLDEVTHFSSSKRKKHTRNGVGGFTYHVLKLPSIKTRSVNKEKTDSHASPRFHVRRAHIRKLSTGELTFVRQCFVGNKNNGVVNKDYAIGKVFG